MASAEGAVPSVPALPLQRIPSDEEQVSNAHELSDVLRDFARTMVTDFSIEAILDHLVQRMLNILPITAAGVTLISPASDPRYVAASDDAALRFEALQTTLGEGPCLLAHRIGRAVSVPDLRQDNKFPFFAPMALREGLAAVFAFPLYHGDRPLGALDLYRDTPGSLTHQEMSVAQTLADVVSAYLLNAQVRDKLQASSNRLREASLHDPLTGLPNRTLLMERLAHAFTPGRASARPSAVYFIDLDRFKTINDAHGHRVGDELLVAVARRLAGLLRPHDTLARLGGDEFVVFCEDLDTVDNATAIGGRMANALSRPFALSDCATTITASIGFAYADRGEHDAEQLVHDADMAMYQAKHSGGARLQLSDAGGHRAPDRHCNLERDLHQAVKRGELHLEYQPIVATKSPRITGFEALLRWTHPFRGLIAPATLIPMAERSELIEELGAWVLHRAWSDRGRWPCPVGAGRLQIAVNVSARQLISGCFTEAVAAVLAAIDHPPHLLTLELTESVFIQDSARALRVLSELKAMGVTLALDDFGTGYSSLNYLRQFPVDIIKIDRAFVADLGRDRAGFAIVNAVVGLAHDLSMTVIAEGVETRSQLDAVTELGCDAYQGFFFSHPLPACGVPAMLRGPARS